MFNSFFEVIISKFPTQGFDLSCKCTPWQKRAQDFQILLPDFFEFFPWTKFETLLPDFFSWVRFGDFVSWHVWKKSMGKISNFTSGYFWTVSMSNISWKFGFLKLLNPFHGHYLQMWHPWHFWNNFPWVKFSNFTSWIYWNFSMNKIWNFASRLFHVLGKRFEISLAKKVGGNLKSQILQLKILTWIS